MAASANDNRLHTYLDDIKYQAVKGDNKRTPFVSSDHQIVSRNAQVIRSIEKTEKIASADFRRQENVLLKKLDRLQLTREKSVYFSNPHPHPHPKSPDRSNSRLSSRRHSAPCLEKTFVSRRNSASSISPTRVLGQASHKTVCSNSNREGRLSISSDGGGNTEPNSPGSLYDDVMHPTFSRQSSTGSQKLSMLEVRRRSHDIQEETSKMAMEKIEQIVSGHKRRATIAEGALSNGVVLPSMELLSRLSRADSGSDTDN